MKTNVGPPLLHVYPSSLYTRPHLWQISGGGGGGIPDPLSPPLWIHACLVLHAQAQVNIGLDQDIYSQWNRVEQMIYIILPDSK